MKNKRFIIDGLRTIKDGDKLRYILSKVEGIIKIDYDLYHSEILILSSLKLDTLERHIKFACELLHMNLRTKIKRY